MSVSYPGTAPTWAANIDHVLFSTEQIKEKVKELAAQISRDYAGERVLVVGLLTGAFMFLADLSRELTCEYLIDFMVCSSYGSGTVSSGNVKLKKDLGIDPAGMHVLVVEDLIDTGNTLAWLRTHLSTKHCKSVKLCCLLNKVSRRTAPVEVEYVGFECPDEFVVGYGMDWDGQYRALPYVAVVKSLKNDAEPSKL